jgi:hypothetical protein
MAMSRYLFGERGLAMRFRHIGALVAGLLALVGCTKSDVGGPGSAGHEQPRRSQQAQ